MSGSTAQRMRIEDPYLADTLVAVGRLMEDAHDPWWVIASAAVALHGADPGPVGDVDMLIGVDDALRILPSIGIEPRAGSAHADFRSDIFGRWTRPPLPVEFMAGFSHRSFGEWQRVEPATREHFQLRGVRLYIPSRAELGDLLRRFGRPKDVVRANRLAAIMP